MNEIQINGYRFPNIDCYHNLLLYSLVSNKYNIALMGAHWPWQFVIDSNGHISSRKMISHKIIKEVYNVSLMRGQLSTNSSTTMLAELRQLLTNTSPILLGVGQLPHTRLLHDESHSIILKEINENTAMCLDTIPVFIGNLDTQVLLHSIGSIKEPWYAYLRFPPDVVSIDEESVFHDFLTEVRSLAQSNRNTYPQDACTTKHILSRISDNRQCINEICTGKWGWHIERNAGLLSLYLETDFVSHHYGTSVVKIQQLIDANTKLWGTAYKQLYMATIVKESRFYESLERAIDSFRKIIDMEMQIIEHLLG